MEDRLARLEGIPAIDAHCHPIDLAKAAGPLVPQLTLSDEPLPEAMLEQTLFVRGLATALAEFLDCEPTYLAVATARQHAIERDRDGYFASLFAACGVETFLLDTGAPLEAGAEQRVDPAFGALVGGRYRTIFRIESEARRLLLHDRSFAEFVDAMCISIDTAVGNGAVGMKSVIAYRTGLGVDPRDVRARAERAYAAIRHDPKDVWSRHQETKGFFDYLFVLALEKGIEHDVPLQVHVGMGDGPLFDMTTAGPSLLRDVLFDEGLRRAKLVLTHAGYPWVEESGWFANQYENVFIDLSEMIPFAAHAAAEKIAGLLEMSPTSKLMYGSDGYNCAEVHWFAAHSGRRALAIALERLEAEGWVRPVDTDDIARGILRHNAAALYHL